MVTEDCIYPWKPTPTKKEFIPISTNVGHEIYQEIRKALRLLLYFPENLV